MTTAIELRSKFSDSATDGVENAAKDLRIRKDADVAISLEDHHPLARATRPEETQTELKELCLSSKASAFSIAALLGDNEESKTRERKASLEIVETAEEGFREGTPMRYKQTSTDATLNEEEEESEIDLQLTAAGGRQGMSCIKAFSKIVDIQYICTPMVINIISSSSSSSSS